MAMHKTFLSALTFLILLPGNALPAELVFHFNGTLEGARSCKPPSDAFCGPYSGILRIDDAQVGRQVTPYSHDYTADVVIVFADNQTASCRRHPAPLSEEIDPYRWTRARYCLISVSRRPENIRTVQLSIDPLEQEVSNVALVYTFEDVEFDIEELTQVLGYLQEPPADAFFSVVGKACSWGRCVDHSITQLVMPENPRDQE